MGYNLTIGEAKVLIQDEEILYISAKSERHDEAPAFDEPTDYTNERWPSYTAWSDFSRAVGLEDVFYEGGNIKGGHPGATPVTKEMQRRINFAIQRMEMQYKGIVAEYDEEKEHQGYYCRLQWLKYWVDWSLENCIHPVLANS